MKKTIASLALAILFFPVIANADGGVVHFDPYSDRWDFSNETNQQAFINFENGTEKMILSVGIGDISEGKTMWIFPVPASPEKVAVDVVKKIPNFRGEELSEKAQSNLDDAKSWLQATQIYALPFVFVGSKTLSTTGASREATLSLGGGSFEDAFQPDVVVYEHLEKEGITSEIVTSRTVQGFNDYFFKKSLKIESNSIPVLQNYIGKNFSFVVSWMEQKELVLTDDEIAKLIEGGQYPCAFFRSNCSNDLYELIKSLENKYLDFGTSSAQITDSSHSYTKYYLTDSQLNDLKQGVKDHPEILRLLNRGQKGVFVTFPTDKIYFPLMPTSVYGSKIVPADIRIIGHISPEIYEDIANFTKTQYFVNGSSVVDQHLKAFYDGPNADIKYTKIEINAPSKFFTNDLWAKNSAPPATFYQSFIAQNALLDIFILLVVCSVSAGVLAGWLLFEEWRNWEGMKKFGLAGLANCVTILGLIAAILPARTIKDPEDASREVDEIKIRGYFWKRRISMGLIIADIPFLFISIFAIPILFFGLIELYAESRIGNGYYYYGEIWEYFLNFLIALIPMLILVAAWYLSRIKKEDRGLFDGLKKKKYSALTFQPKDRRKIWFIILFSIFFLVIAWAVTRFLVFSVGG